MCGGNKAIIGAEKLVLYFLTRKLFSHWLLCRPSFIFEKRNWMAEWHRGKKIKIDKVCVCSVCV